MANKVFEDAKKTKNDEFYTQIRDIENELRHYKDHLRDKVIFCNCDDPVESNFWRYFALNFTHLGLKKLIATHFETTKPSYKLELTGDMDENGVVNSDDIIKTTLRQNGDFRSPECIELLKEADIVITNPPFSLFREYVAQLMEYNKQFLIIGSKNAITYKEVFSLIKSNKIWMGYGFANGNAYFRINPHNQDDYANGVYDPETGMVKFRNVSWFTNLDLEKRHENITLYKKYNPEEYPHYDNYDAIEVSKVSDIPIDWDGAMGVPITFLDRYNPEQFDILGITQGRDEYGTKPTKWYINPKQINPDGTVANGGKVNTGAEILLSLIPKGVYFTADNADGPLQRVYARILIKRKDVAQ
jgi:hypothetical protein